MASSSTNTVKSKLALWRAHDLGQQMKADKMAAQLRNAQASGRSIAIGQSTHGCFHPFSEENLSSTSVLCGQTDLFSNMNDGPWELK